MAAIRFEQVGKRFGSTQVLERLELGIADGEFFTFVGPSGCGKSTLLGLIAGIETPSEGHLYLDEQPIDDLPPAARDVAMVFQSYALYPHMTVAENLAFPLANRRVPRATVAAEVARIAATLGLGDLLERRPKALSGGQRQRVALGRALIRRPRVFLMDEPLSNLDARLRLEMRDELKRLHASHRITTVYVTHDQEEAMTLSDRIAVLNGGRLQQCGTPEEVYAAPANRFVAGFIGSPPMNFLPGALIAEESALRARFAMHDSGRTIAGLRPADVTVHVGAASGRLPMEVSLVEPTGSDTWVVGEWRGQRIKGRAATGERIVPGTHAFFEPVAQGLHLFDAASGERLS